MFYDIFAHKKRSSRTRYSARTLKSPQHIHTIVEDNYARALLSKSFPDNQPIYVSTYRYCISPRYMIESAETNRFLLMFEQIQIFHLPSA